MASSTAVRDAGLRQSSWPDLDSRTLGYERCGRASTGAQLVVAVGSADGDALVLIDPADGDRTDLGHAAGDVTSLAWSPDGTRIAYGAVPAGTRNDQSPIPGSVYSVKVGDGDHSVLASQVGDVSGGETGSGIRRSPDGTRIAVLAEAEENRLYLMNADGSDLDLVTEGVVIEHTLGSPGLVWSSDGTRIAYATFTGDRKRLQIWNGSPDGSAPILVFESPPIPGARLSLSGNPVTRWRPARLQILLDLRREARTGCERRRDRQRARNRHAHMPRLAWRLVLLRMLRIVPRPRGSRDAVGSSLEVTDYSTEPGIVVWRAR
jgi:hypothetical protein